MELFDVSSILTKIKEANKMTKCALCDDELKMMVGTKLSSGEKICEKCDKRVKKDLNIGWIKLMRSSLTDIKNMYNSMERDIDKEIKQEKENLDYIRNIGIYTKSNIELQSGNQVIGTKTMATIAQLNDGRVVFNPNSQDFYYLTGLSFDGARYQEISQSETKNTTNTNGKEKTKKKGKSGKVATGAIIGSMIMPGIGTAVGAYAGSKGKDKTKKKSHVQTINGGSTTQTTEQVEIPSVAHLELYRISDNRTVKISVIADSAKFNELEVFQVRDVESTTLNHEEILSKLKELKELLDMAIITQEEFDEKKNEYMEKL